MVAINCKNLAMVLGSAVLKFKHDVLLVGYSWMSSWMISVFPKPALFCKALCSVEASNP